jgi:hypothetical protein
MGAGRRETWLDLMQFVTLTLKRPLTLLTLELAFKDHSLGCRFLLKLYVDQ